jgi:hypothetical protein
MKDDSGLHSARLIARPAHSLITSCCLSTPVLTPLLSGNPSGARLAKSHHVLRYQLLSFVRATEINAKSVSQSGIGRVEVGEIECTVCFKGSREADVVAGA